MSDTGRFMARFLIGALALAIAMTPRFVRPAAARPSTELIPRYLLLAAADSTLTAGQPSAGSEPAAVSPLVRPRPWLALSEVVATNLVIWSYDRYIREGGTNPGFRIGFNSWEENFLNGFEYDDNNFTTNQFAHPYHGNIYFNAARANGYDFWTSIPFAFAGSFMWEYLFEIHHPAYNDWVNTSVGGASLGEMFWRVSDLVIDETATGGERRWREVLGTLINPMRGFNRIVTGEVSRVGPNPEGRLPSYLAARLDAGMRTIGQEEFGDLDTTRVFLELAGQYGNPFGEDRRRPFDSFNFGLQINFSDVSGIGALYARGLLYATDMSKGESAHHLFGVYLNYDYYNNSAYVLGGQSLAASIQSRFNDTFLGDLETQAFLGPILIAGVESDYESYTGRAYDYGPGAQAGLGLALKRESGRPWLQLRHTQAWVHVLNGLDGDHHLSVSRVRLDQPIGPAFGLGAEYLLYLEESRYQDLPDGSDRFPELRFYLSLPMN